MSKKNRYLVIVVTGRCRSTYACVYYEVEARSRYDAYCEGIRKAKDYGHEPYQVGRQEKSDLAYVFLLRETV